MSGAMHFIYYINNIITILYYCIKSLCSLHSQSLIDYFGSTLLKFRKYSFHNCLIKNLHQNTNSV